MTLDEIVAVYVGRDPDRTKALYARLMNMPPRGIVAVNLLRVARNSEMAKGYRGRSIRAAYDNKDWAMGQLCRALAESDGVLAGWGWGRDEKAVNFENVLYCDLPTGQVSFHAARRHEGPTYPGAWDGAKRTAMIRICRWTEAILGGREVETEGGRYGGEQDRAEGSPGEGAARSARVDEGKQEALDL